MSDLVKRLNRYGAISARGQDHPQNMICREAAALIESQDERIKALEAGLKPFAVLYAEILALQQANPDMPQDLDGWALTCKGPDLRHAASLLEEKK